MELPLPRLLRIAVHLAALGMVVGCASSHMPPMADVESARFIGAVTIPNDEKVDSTVVGGLSGIDYDAGADLWYLISDDKSEKNAARFYLAKLGFDKGALASASIEHSVTLRQEDGKPYPGAKAGGEVPDPEAISRDPDTGNLWWTSEGDRKLGLSPFVRVTAPNGGFVADIPTPPMFRMNRSEDVGPRHNLAFEGLSFTPDGRSVWLAMESALYQDGAIATPTAGTVLRITRLDRSGKVLAQYAYPVDPIQAVPTGENGDNGVSEILALDDHRALVLERSGVEGADGIWTMYIRIYEIDTKGASNVAKVPSLAGASYKPLTKRLIIDLSKHPEIGRVDNIEGMSWGPTLPDGKRSLVLVSDNNFNPAQITQFLAFEVQP